MIFFLTTRRFPSNPLSSVTSSSGRQTRCPRITISDPAIVLQHGAVDGPVRGEPALDPLKVRVGDGGRRRAHDLLEGVIVTARGVGLDADADGGHAGRPLAVGQTAVDVLVVIAPETVAVLAVVAGNRAPLVLLVAPGDLGQGQGGLGSAVSEVVSVGDGHGRRTVGTGKRRLGWRD